MKVKNKMKNSHKYKLKLKLLLKQKMIKKYKKFRNQENKENQRKNLIHKQVKTKINFEKICIIFILPYLPMNRKIEKVVAFYLIMTKFFQFDRIFLHSMKFIPFSFSIFM